MHYGSSLGVNGNFGWYAESDQAWALFGNSVGTAGDVNGDGYDDIIVGAWSWDNGEIEEGAVFVWHGSSMGLSGIGKPNNANWFVESNQTQPRFGWSVNTAGDVNGDGFADVIIGSYDYSNGQSGEGRALVYHGSASGLATSPNWVIEGNQDVAEFGRSVASAGDVNGDGYADVIVGAPGVKKSYVYYGSSYGLSAKEDWSVTDMYQFGYSVGTAGDVNGDGYSDVLIGDPGAEKAFVYHGSPNGGTRSAWAWAAESNQKDAHMGFSVGTAGDARPAGADVDADRTGLRAAHHARQHGGRDESAIYPHGVPQGVALSAGRVQACPAQRFDGAHHRYHAAC